MAGKPLEREAAVKLLERFRRARTKGADYMALTTALRALPPGVPPALVTEVLTTQLNGFDGYLSSVARLPEAYTPAAVAALRRAKQTPEIAFVLAGLPKRPAQHRAALQRLVDARRGLEFAERANTRAHRPRLARQARDPALVAGARAAAGLEPEDEWFISRFLPVLAAEGSPASIAVVRRQIGSALAGDARDLDDLARELVPLLAATPAARKLADEITAARDRQAAANPARALAARLGVDLGATPLRFTATLKGTSATLPELVLKVDGSQANWYEAKLNWFTHFFGGRPNPTHVKEPHPGDLSDFPAWCRRAAKRGKKGPFVRLELKTRHGGEARRKLQAWLEGGLG